MDRWQTGSVAFTRAATVGATVFRYQRTKQAGLLRICAQRAAHGAPPAIDELLPDRPSLQGYTVCEIDESLTGPLVKWLRKRPD